MSNPESASQAVMIVMIDREHGQDREARCHGHDMRPRANQTIEHCQAQQSSARGGPVTIVMHDITIVRKHSSALT